MDSEGKRLRQIAGAFEQGYRQGYEQEFKKEFEKGYAEGIEIGKNLVANEVARKLKADGYDISLIADCTSLSYEQILAL